jgi:hypothetical protein
MTADHKSAETHPDAGPGHAPPTDLIEPFPTGSTYPELIPVITSVVDAMIYRFDLEVDGDAELIDQLAEIAIAKSHSIYGPMAAVADRASHYTRHLRDVQSETVIRVAETLAAQVADEAATLRTRSEAKAAAVAREAADRAAAVAAAVGPDDRSAAAAAAAQADDVRSAAAHAAAERAYAAATVAQQAAESAAEAVEEAELLALTVELEAAIAEKRTRGVAIATSHQAALEATLVTAERILTKGHGAEVRAVREPKER